jgi:Uma2 family endonuclease
MSMVRTKKDWPPVVEEEEFPIDYPSSDGEPVAETQLHLFVIFDLLHSVDWLLAQRTDVWYACNVFWYYQQGNNKARRAPDLMVVFGVPKLPRRDSFFSWIEGAVPSIIFEITSRKTWDEDWIYKKGLYEERGVQEYILYDPRHEYLERRLMGFRLMDGKYQPIALDVDESLVSEVLGVRITPEEEYLRLTVLSTGEVIPHREELASTVEDAKQRAEQERRRAEAAETELARLRALLNEREGANGDEPGK